MIKIERGTNDYEGGGKSLIQVWYMPKDDYVDGLILIRSRVSIPDVGRIVHGVRVFIIL